MRVLQRIVNSLSGLAIDCLSFCNRAPSTTEISACTGVQTGEWFLEAIETVTLDAATLRTGSLGPVDRLTITALITRTLRSVPLATLCSRKRFDRSLLDVVQS
jgi:hypothetical protein